MADIDLGSLAFDWDALDGLGGFFNNAIDMAGDFGSDDSDDGGHSDGGGD
jgi:hypothetical protein